MLFLLDPPARSTAGASTMLSPDNNDPVAANVWEFYRASGLPASGCDALENRATNDGPDGVRSSRRCPGWPASSTCCPSSGW